MCGIVVWGQSQQTCVRRARCAGTGAGMLRASPRQGCSIYLRKENGLVKDVFRTRHMRE